MQKDAAWAQFPALENAPTEAFLEQQQQHANRIKALKLEWRALVDKQFREKPLYVTWRGITRRDYVLQGMVKFQNSQNSQNQQNQQDQQELVTLAPLQGGRKRSGSLVMSMAIDLAGNNSVGGGDSDISSEEEGLPKAKARAKMRRAESSSDNNQANGNDMDKERGLEGSRDPPSSSSSSSSSRSLISSPVKSASLSQFRHVIHPVLESLSRSSSKSNKSNNSNNSNNSYNTTHCGHLNGRLKKIQPRTKKSSKTSTNTEKITTMTPPRRKRLRANSSASNSNSNNAEELENADGAVRKGKGRGSSEGSTRAAIPNISDFRYGENGEMGECTARTGRTL